jgi:hypothetical protein
VEPEVVSSPVAARSVLPDQPAHDEPAHPSWSSRAPPNVT